MKYLHLILMLFCANFLVAQNNAKDYIDRYKNIAIQQMATTDIPASITLAQAILHTSVGTNTLATQANNHFSLSCNDAWEGEVLYRFKENVPTCYKVFDSPAESFLEHTIWLSNSSTYENLFYIEPTNYKRWAKGLEALEYSTAPKYSEQLIQIIELYELYELDKEVERLGNSVDSNSSEVIYSAENDTYTVNGLEAVIARNDETPLELAARMKIPLRKLLKYNDIDLVDGFYSGQYVFLEKKKSKFTGEQLTHKVEQNDNLYLIAQTYGIRLNKLEGLNRLKDGEEPAVGQEVALQERVEEKLTLRSSNFIPQPASEEVLEEEEETVKPPVRIVTPPISVKPDVPVLDNQQPNVPTNTNTTVVENTNVIDKEIIYVYPDDPSYEGEVEVIGNTSKPSPKPIGKPIITNPNRVVEEISQNATVPKPITIPENVHVVVKGETLYSISKKYNLPVQRLKDLNGLVENTIEIDQWLKVK